MTSHLNWVLNRHLPGREGRREGEKQFRSRQGKNNDILGNGALFTMAETSSAWDKGESDNTGKISRRQIMEDLNLCLLKECAPIGK